MGVVCLLAGASAGLFDDQVVLRLTATSEAAAEAIGRLEGSDAEIDVWSRADPGSAGSPVDVRMPRAKAEAVLRALAPLGVRHATLINDLQARVDTEWRERRAAAAAPRAAGDGWASSYHSFDEIVDYFTTSASALDPRRPAQHV